MGMMNQPVDEYINEWQRVVLWSYGGFFQNDKEEDNNPE
jgi:hypothetical protein